MQKPLSDDAFFALRDLLLKDSGIYLADRCRTMVVQRLRHRLKVTGCKGFWAYYQHVAGLERSHPERIAMVNALTTNRTGFFREAVHFEDLRTEIIPRIVHSGGRTGVLKVWCAACSTGEEAWSLAMLVDDALRSYSVWRGEITATDINTDVLEQAKAGVYRTEAVRDVPDDLKQRYLLRGYGRWEGYVRIAAGLKEMVTFSRFNLAAASWPAEKEFHIVFCRNILIYFNSATQKRVIEGVASLLTSPGWLVVGLAETTILTQERFKTEKGTILRHERAKVAGLRGRLAL